MQLVVDVHFAYHGMYTIGTHPHDKRVLVDCCRSDAAKDQVDVRGMRGMWQQTLLDEGVVDMRLKRTVLAEQLGAVAAAGLMPSELKVM
jgi:hypothetical protein